MYGPGVEEGLIRGRPTTFTVDCTEAGQGNVSVGVKCSTDDLETDVKFEINKNEGKDTFTVDYTPEIAGVFLYVFLNKITRNLNNLIKI